MAESRATRRAFLQSAGGAIGAAVAGRVSAGAKRGKPNLLFIMSDQQHGGALGFVDPFFETPNLDSLAGESIVFENAFCATPQCSPSRSSILTGLYPHKTRIYGNVGNAIGYADRLDHTNLGELFQKAGYRTAWFGKWHLGDREGEWPGWDEQFLFANDGETTRRGIEFLSRRTDPETPFALFLSYRNPHDIYHFKPGSPDVANLKIPLPPSWAVHDFSAKPAVQFRFMTEDQGKRHMGWDEEGWQEYRDFYRGKVRLFDQELGRVVGVLKEYDFWEDTIVVATSDHGDMEASHRLIFKGPFMYENMVKVPLLFRIPPRFGGGDSRRVAELVPNVDLAPTLLGLAGADPHPCDGNDLSEALVGAAATPSRDFVIGQYFSKQKWVNPIRMIRTPDWKYNRYIVWGEELYDLRNDPGEIVNLAADPGHRRVKKELRAELARWMKENDDPFDAFGITTRDGVHLRPEDAEST